MTTQPPTIIPARTQAQWTQDLLDVFPAPWTNDVARLPGGNLYAIMGSMAANLQIINDFLVYGFDASRIETATDTELDLCADDFYGPNGLPRQTGESDASYRVRIEAGLFIPYTTKEAFIQAITALTGIAPRLIQPWVAAQTAAFDYQSFFDIDFPPLAPSLYGDPALRYIGAVIATLPNPIDVNAPTAIWGFDAGAGYDTYTGTMWNLVAANFVSVEQLDALIMRIKAFGITIWRKYLYQSALPVPLPATFQVASGLSSFPINIQAFNGPYVVIASCNWNAAVNVTGVTSSGFTINTNTPSPSLSPQISYVILPATYPGVGFVPVSSLSPRVTVPIPQSPSPSGKVVALTPSWNTTVSILSISGSTMTVAFGTPPPNAAQTLNYYFAPPSNAALLNTPPAALSLPIPVPTMPAQSAVFVVPNWNAQVSVQPESNLIQANFNTPAPNSAYVHYTYFPVPGAH
jgi:hypothetical protein